MPDNDSILQHNETWQVLDVCQISLIVNQNAVDVDLIPAWYFKW